MIGYRPEVVHRPSRGNIVYAPTSSAPSSPTTHLTLHDTTAAVGAYKGNAMLLRRNLVLHMTSESALAVQ
nr:hypothetical protein CFP56_53749 [Quercus suber]